MCFVCVLSGKLFAMGATEAPDLCTDMGGKYSVKVDNLRNEDCTATNKDGSKQVVWRERKEEENIRGIMLHYTACRSIEATKRTYLACGISAHRTIAKNGVIFEHVDDKNVAFHAGVSAFREMSELNRYFLGIEHVNPGFEERGNSYNYGLWGTPVKIEGDPRKWFAFNDDQFKASAILTAELQKKYRIPGSLVTHADAAVGRKSDIGPMYNYRRAFSEFDEGYYPVEKKVTASSKNLTDSNYIDLIKLYGYQFSSSRCEKDLIRAFQMHFSQTNISGTMDDATKKAILTLCVDYAGYVDTYTRTVDKTFSEELDAFLTNHPQAESVFGEYI